MHTETFINSLTINTFPLRESLTKLVLNKKGRVYHTFNKEYFAINRFNDRERIEFRKFNDEFSDNEFPKSYIDIDNQCINEELINDIISDHVENYVKPMIIKEYERAGNNPKYSQFNLETARYYENFVNAYMTGFVYIEV